MVTGVSASSPRTLVAASVAVGAAATIFLLWLIYIREPGGGSAALAWLPAFNATCNAASASCVVLGYLAIRERRRRLHASLMLAAFACSLLFLAGYVTHHALHGDTRFGGAGIGRAVYLAILASHIGLSAVALPLVLVTFSLAAARHFDAHRRVARWTLPIWLYVSVTGVVVYFMLRAPL